MEDAIQRRRRMALGVIFALTCAGLVVGWWGFWPYLEREHRRLEPWQVALIWVGDVTTLGWFARFVVQHILHGQPF